MKRHFLSAFALALAAIPVMGADEGWQDMGTGTYREILFSDLYGLPQQTLSVRFERNAADPTMFRIPNLYENMDFSAYPGLEFDASNAEPMVFHTYNDRYAYFDEFDTGVYIDFTNSSLHYDGEVRMLMQGVDLLAQNDLETLVNYLPECLCRLKNGLLTLDATFELQNNYWNNVLGLVYVTGTAMDDLFRGNTRGDFLITLPEAGDYDPDEDWKDIGNALFTDGLTEGLYAANPQYYTWEVPMQRNMVYTERYRLVNPYANWPGKIDGVGYDADNTFYMDLVIEDFDGFSLVGIPTFLTGLTKEGEGYYAISNQAADFADESYDFLAVYQYFPGCFGMLEDGVITYPSHCVIDMEYYLNFFGYFGSLTEFSTFYSANSKGNLKIVMPGFFTPEGPADDPDLNGVGAVEAEDAPEKFFTLQGVRVADPAPGQILIRRQGADVSKVVVR